MDNPNFKSITEQPRAGEEAPGLQALAKHREIIFAKNCINDKNGLDIYTCSYDHIYSCCDNSISVRLTEKGKDVITMYKENRACAGCCWCAGNDNCCSISTTIKDGKGDVLGVWTQDRSLCGQGSSLLAEDGSTIATFKTPCCICCCFPYEYRLISKSDGNEMATVTIHGKDSKRQLFPNELIITATFDKDLDVKMKAAIASGTVFMGLYWRMAMQGGQTAGMMAATGAFSGGHGGYY